MLTACQCFHSYFRMYGMGHGDDHGIQTAIMYQLPPVRIALYAGIPFQTQSQPLRIDITDRRQPQAFDPAPANGGSVGAAHISNTN